jgi:hypothetical protein
MIMKWPGVTTEQYEKVRKSVNWEGNKPDGAVFHVCAFGNHYMHVTDIWESADEFTSFAQNRLMPAVEAAGIHGQPEVDVIPLHAIYIPDPGNLS